MFLICEVMMAKSPRQEVSIKVEMTPSRCPICGSTERSPYHGTIEREIAGTLVDGRSYTHVVWRRTTCVCGQQRIDRSYENRTSPTRH